MILLNYKSFTLAYESLSAHFLSLIKRLGDLPRHLKPRDEVTK